MGVSETAEIAPTRDFSRAEDGIRTRDPHLGKVVEMVQGVSGGSSELATRPRNVHRIRPNSTLLPKADQGVGGPPWHWDTIWPNAQFRTVIVLETLLTT